MLTVEDAKGTASSSGYTLGGTLINPASSEIRSIAVVGTVYNAAGAVIGYRKIILPDSLAANASVEFAMPLPGITDAARWAVIAEGRLP